MAGILNNIKSPGATEDFSQWDWSTKNLQGDVIVGEYVSSESSIILAGPSRLDAIQGGVNLIPLGKTLSMDLRQSKQNQPIFEIGARRAYMLSDKQTVNGSLRSVMFYGKSMLKMLYEKTYNTGPDTDASADDQYQWKQLLKNDKPGAANSDYWGAFSSRLFTDPVGLAILFRTNRNKPYGGVYIEDVLLNDFSTQVTSTQAVMMESAGFDASFVKPITLTQAPVTTGG